MTQFYFLAWGIHRSSRQFCDDASVAANVNSPFMAHIFNETQGAVNEDCAETVSHIHVRHWPGHFTPLRSLTSETM
jgi:hypothetical protein